MKNPLLATVSVATVAGAATAAVFSLWLAPEASRPGAARSVSSTPTSSADDGELRRELERLALENQALTVRIEELERRPVPTPRTELAARAPEQDEGADVAPLDELGSLLLARDLPETVRATLEDIRAEEEAEQQRQREAREAERREERLTRLQQELGLSNGQVGDLRTWMIESRTAREDLERQRAAGGDRGELRAARGELRTRDEESLQRILSPAQYQAWQEREKRDDERGRRGERDAQRTDERGQG